MQPHHYIALSFLAAVGWAFLVLVRQSPDDAESGTLIGQVSPQEDAFQHGAGPQTNGAPVSNPERPAKHFIVACSHCCRVKGSDGQPVRVGDELRVSHGLCPDCARAWEEEAAQLTSAATVQTA